jgi:large subunit ribosomal protein L4
LSYKAQSESIRVLENFSFDAPKTRDMAALISALDLTSRKVLVLTGGYDANLYKSGRNLPKVEVREAASASTLDLLDADVLVFQEDALDAITAVLGAGANGAASGEDHETESED